MSNDWSIVDGRRIKVCCHNGQVMDLIVEYVDNNRIIMWYCHNCDRHVYEGETCKENLERQKITNKILTAAKK